MDFKDALTMYFERGMALQTYWNFYITIGIGYLAFVGIVTPGTRKPLLPSLLTAGFILFAIVNYEGLEGVANQRLMLEGLLRSTKLPLPFDQYPAANTLELIRASFNAPQIWQIRLVHALGDLIMVAVIWVSFFVKKDRIEADAGS